MTNSPKQLFLYFFTVLFYLIAPLEGLLPSSEQAQEDPLLGITSFKSNLEAAFHSPEEVELQSQFPLENYKVYKIDQVGSFYVDDCDDMIKNSLRAGSIWDKPLLDLMRKYAKPGTVVIDIGAHIGTETIPLSNFVGKDGQVITFEPQKKLFRELVMNIELNEQKNVTAYRCALGNGFDMVEMNPPYPKNEGATALGKGGDPVKMIPLDSLKLENVSLIKIDVENYELEVLKGAKETILKNRPYIIIEILGNTYSPIPNREENVQKILHFIQDMGYDLAFIEGSWSDWLATPKDEQSITNRPTVTLNMIVKNESKVITRCLASVLPFIDYWVIADTGSTDGTQDIIKQFMNDNNIPGDLFESTWIDFSHNRNQALEFAKGKGDYVLFMDADEYLVQEDGFKWPVLDRDFYYFTISHTGTEYGRIQLVKNSLNWRYEGVLHEVIIPPYGRTSATIDKLKTIYTTEGARSQDPKKYQKDAELLQAAFDKDPSNSRTAFYLAQSYKDAGEYEKAIEFYDKRAAMSHGPSDEEAFWSLFQIASLKDFLKNPSDDVVNSYLKAFHYRNTRAEPLYYAAQHFRLKDDYKTGYLIANLAKDIPPPKDILFVQHWIYDYGTLLELSINAYWIDKFDECRQISLELLKKDNLPGNVRSCVEQNLRFANAKLAEQICKEALIQ